MTWQESDVSNRSMPSDSSDLSSYPSLPVTAGVPSGDLCISPQNGQFLASSFYTQEWIPTCDSSEAHFPPHKSMTENPDVLISYFVQSKDVFC